MTQLTIGFLSNGKSTNRYHLPFLLERRQKIRVKTIYARDLTKTDWPRLEDINYTDKLDNLLTDPEIDLVVCTTPAETHFELGKAILEAGKHCLMEKPFTQTLAEAKILLDMAKAKGLLIQPYQNRRFDSDFLTTQAVIASGKLGDLLEVEMHYDYYRPEVPLGQNTYKREHSFIYGHACHTLDQVLSYFGNPDHIHYDVRQILGKGRMNDYFDLDLYYQNLKVSVKSSYFRVVERPSFVVYGKRGRFVKTTKDRQEADLKKFYMPNQPDFGQDLPEHYGILSYYDENGDFHEEKVVTVPGDYGRYYDALYNSIIHGTDKLVTDEQTLSQMSILEEAVNHLS